MTKKQRVMPRHLEAAPAAVPQAAMMTAAYIAELAAELEKMADQQGIEAVADALRAARIEALRFSALKAA